MLFCLLIMFPTNIDEEAELERELTLADELEAEIEDDEEVERPVRSIINEPEPEAEDKLVDLHVCGACEAVFDDVEIFVEHKRKGCAKRKQAPSRRLLPSKTSSSNATTSSTATKLDNSSSKQSQLHSKSETSKPEKAFEFTPRPSDTLVTQSPLDIITDSFVPET